METVCKHLPQVRPVEPLSSGCAACVEAGSSWVHLRLCLTCGHVGCCNQSEHRHALRHYLDTGHPLMQSYERMDEWAFCWTDEIFLLPQITIHRWVD